MPNLMTNYPFGGGGVLLIRSSTSFFKSSISKARVRINSELCSMQPTINSNRGSQSLLFFLHSSKLECFLPARLEQGVLEAWSEDMTRSSPSCRHPCCPLKLGRLCHQ